MQTITAYICEFCPQKKARMSKGRTKKHEAQCFYNPARRACASCGNYTKATGIGEDCEGPYCEADNFNKPQPEEPAYAMFRYDCDQWIPRNLVASCPEVELP